MSVLTRTRLPVLLSLIVLVEPVFAQATTASEATQKNVSTSSVQHATSASAKKVAACGDVRPDNSPPVRLDELGENWHYAKEADKLPVIVKFVNSRPLVEASQRPNRFPICKAFFNDLKLGKDIVVIEPDIQALTENDPAVERWATCPNSARWDGVVPKAGEIPFFGWTGLPPYWVYRVKINSTDKEMATVLLQRQLGSGYWRTYDAVNLEACEVTGGTQVISFRSCTTGTDIPDSISTMIRYRGSTAVLSYIPWGEDGQAGVGVNFFTQHGYCTWYVADPTKNSKRPASQLKQNVKPEQTK